MYQNDKCILEQLNKYIMFDDNTAVQYEDIMIGLIKKYYSQTEEMLFGDNTIIKYLLMYLRKKKKEINSDTWIAIIEGSYINHNFIEFLKSHNVWNDYTAKLLCITNKDNIRCSEIKCFLSETTDWLTEESMVNDEFDDALNEMPDFSDDITIIYEWDKLRDTEEWNKLDVSTFKSRDNLTGISLMKYLDTTLTKEQIIDRIMCYYENDEYDVKSHYYEVYLDEKNIPRIRFSYIPLLFNAKQYDNTNPIYLFQEDEEKHAGISTRDFRILNPTNVQIVTISKENNIKKLVIETQEDHTVHLLFDKLPKNLINDVHKFERIGLANQSETILKKKILDNYKVCAEFNSFTKTILNNPFLIENQNATLDLMHNSPFLEYYIFSFIDFQIVPFFKTFLYKIDDVSYDKNSKQTKLKLVLTEKEMENLKNSVDDDCFPEFGDLQFKNNKTVILTIRDIYCAFPYNAIAQADGSNDFFKLIKENNYIQLFWLPTSEISDKLGDFYLIFKAYESKIF